MQIDPAEVSNKRQIGTLSGDPVFQVSTKGGLHLVIALQKGKTRTLGMASHQAIARHIAQVKEPDLNITELAKSDQFPYSAYQHLVPRWTEITDRAIALQGE